MCVFCLIIYFHVAFLHAWKGVNFYVGFCWHKISDLLIRNVISDETIINKSGIENHLIFYLHWLDHLYCLWFVYFLNAECLMFVFENHFTTCVIVIQNYETWIWFLLTFLMLFSYMSNCILIIRTHARTHTSTVEVLNQIIYYKIPHWINRLHSAYNKFIKVNLTKINTKKFCEKIKFHKNYGDFFFSLKMMDVTIFIHKFITLFDNYDLLNKYLLILRIIMYV